jgi:hypothetical protein
MTQSHERATPEIVGDASRARVLVVVLGTLAMLVVANAVSCIALRRHPVNRSNWLVREKWRLLDAREDADTLILGDSSCSQGVRPDILDRALEAHSLNLCTVGNMLAVNDVWMLGEYIRLHGRPKRVFIIHVYNMWARTADGPTAQLLGKIDRPWGFWNELQPPLDLDLSLRGDVAVSRWFPLYGENTSLLRFVEAPFLGLPRQFAIDPKSGFMKVVTPNPSRVLKDANDHVDELRRQAAQHTPVVSDVNRHALDALRVLAEREHLDVTIMSAPIFAGLWNEPATQQRYRDISAVLHASVGTSPYIRIIDEAPATFSEREMENVDHVVGESAVAYTRWVLDVLRRR